VQILVSVANSLVRSQRSEARKGSNTMSISVGLVSPKGEGYPLKKFIFSKNIKTPEREAS
jgi:hypothetical protein